jgi:hypothetical protein
VDFSILLEVGLSLARICLPEINVLNETAIIFGIINFLCLLPVTYAFCSPGDTRNGVAEPARAPLLAVVPHDLPVEHVSLSLVEQRTASREVQECLDWILKRDHRDCLWQTYSRENHFFREYVCRCAKRQRLSVLPGNKEELCTFLENLNTNLCCPVALSVPEHPCRITGDTIYVFERASLLRIEGTRGSEAEVPVRHHPITRVPFRSEDLRKPKKTWKHLFGLTHTLWKEHKIELQILARSRGAASTPTARTSLIRWNIARQGAPVARSASHL